MGGGPRECRRAIYKLPTGVIGSFGKEQGGGGKEEARVSAEVLQGERSKNGHCLVLTQGNVATFGATSRRSGQRRDVTEKDYVNVATFGETSRRSRECY